MRPDASAFVVVAWLCGCSPADEESSLPAGNGGCAPGEQLVGEVCVGPGVPPEACAAGFEPDGVRGCRALLPAEPCPKGTMATPGTTVCAEVAPCGQGTWGSIPVEVFTEHVDLTYPGVDSDGSAAKPWRTIQAAVDAALPGAVVAVAAGRYVGDVLIVGKSAVRLWGRCPALVEIVGNGTSLCAVGVLDGSHMTEVRDLAITGSRCGMGASGSEAVVAERVWIHDTGSESVIQDNDRGPSEMTIRASLLEGGRMSGVYLRGATLSVEASVIRDSLQGPNGTYGRCMVGQWDSTGSAVRADLTVRGSLLERCTEMGIMVGGSDLEVEATVVRSTLPQPTSQQFGRGINMQDLGSQPSRATVRGTVVEDSHDVGIFVGGSEALLEAVVVRGTQPEAANTETGGAVIAQKNPTTLFRSNMTLRASLLEASSGMGIAVTGSDGVLEDVLVRRTDTGDSGLYGDGILVLDYDVLPTTAAVVRSRVEASSRAGISSFGAKVDVTATIIECAAFALSADPVDGLTAEFRDLGGNVCGCGGATNACAVVSANLQPPVPVVGAN